MPTTSQITLTDECHFVVPKQSTEERDVPQHIPRPPNAFMLYRSDFLKSQVVPPDVEKRQQNLSRIVGQCWNGLSDTEKTNWFSKAAVVRAEHCAKYQSCMAGPFRKDKKRHSTKDKKRGATNSGHSFGRFRTRRIRTPYCDGMFAALHEPISPSLESQSGLPSPTPVSGSPFPTTALPLPLFLPHVLPSFNPPSVTPNNSVIRRDKFGYPLDLLGSETSWWGPSHETQNSEITPSKNDPSRKIDSMFQRYRHEFASYVPYTQLPEPGDDHLLIFPRSSIVPQSAGCQAT